jgi:hypothetical protein
MAPNWVLATDYVGSPTLRILRPLPVDPPYRISYSINHLVSNGQTSSRAGAGSIEHMQGPLLTNNTKILQEFAARRKSLRSHTGITLYKIIDLYLRHQTLQQPTEELLANGTLQLLPAHCRIANQESPKTTVGKSLDHVSDRIIRSPICLARQRQHGIWAGFHSAANHPGKMDAKKRKSRVRHRIKQISNQVLAILL